MKRFRNAIVLAALLAAGSAAAQVGPPAGPPRPAPRCLAGSYDGGQTELAATLELKDDHRFSYTLSYGALDELGEGKWESDGATSVLLTSDPTTPPRFTLESAAFGAPGRLRLDLDLPRGISRQYFNAIVRFADGRSVQRQFAEEGLDIELDGNRPTGVTLLLPVFDLQSETFPLAEGNGEARFRFAPNDLGKVAFAQTPLAIEREDLLLERHERQIRFKRKGNCEKVAG